MKKIVTLITSAVLCIALTACDNSQPENDNNQTSPSPTLTLAPENITSVPKDLENPSADLTDMKHAYADALENLRNNHILPDGTDCGFEPSSNMADNKFSIYDIDNDGKEELLIMYTTTVSAGMTGGIFAYDETTKELLTELNEFPLLTFYDNGIVKAGWSHNQGLGGDFWSYTLYQYTEASDTYKCIGMVDAWDRKFSERNETGNSFPSEIDQSGTGVVYYIMKDKNYDYSNPADASEYNAWVNSYLGDASEIQIEYKALTEENILQLRNKK